MAQNLLVIEDSKDLIEAWAILFRASTDFNIRFCTSGQAALDVVSEGFNPDIILSDYYLGDTDGLNVVGKLRETSPHAKVIIVSGNNEQAAVLSSRKDGQFKFLAKPIKFDVLLRHILAC